MNTEYISFYCKDGVELQGLLYSPKVFADTTLIHVHGLAGNFYENPFVHAIANEVTKNNCNFLSFNNRGHDYISDLRIKTEKGFAGRKGGGAYELFEESAIDIDGAIKYILKRGSKHIFLEGHSSGANKIVFYLALNQDRNIKGGCLLSPCDDIGLQLNEKGEFYYQILEKSKDMIEKNDGDKLMPEGSFFDYPISAKTYYDYFSPKSKRDTFPYRNEELEFYHLSKISQPLLIIFGNDGEYLLDDVNDTIELIKKKAKRSAKLESFVVDGAPHNYATHETKLSRIISNWIKSTNQNSENGKK